MKAEKTESKKTPTQTVLAIGEIDFTGNIIPHNWYDHVKLENGKCDLVAITLLSEVVWWYRPSAVHDENTKKFLGYEKKFDGDKLQYSYSQFMGKFGLTRKQVFRALNNLRGMGLIETEKRTIKTKKAKLGNVLFIDIIPNKIKEITFPKNSPLLPESHKACAFQGASLVTSKAQACDLKGTTYTKITTKTTNKDILAPQNGASKNIVAQIKSSEPSNFEKLIDWWYKCKGEENPGLEPPRYKGKRFTEVVTDRLNENRTWEQIDAAVKVYWEIVKSPAHYYDSRGDITWFIAMGIDRFWSPKDAMEFFKIKNKNGTNGKTEHRVTPAPDNLYFKSPGKKQVSAEARAAEDVELMATIKSIKSKFDKVNIDAEISV